MKLKENKGISLIVFTIILAVLVVVAVGVIVYLRSELKGLEKTPIGEEINFENIVNKNDNDIENGKVENPNNENEDVEKRNII